MRHWFRSWVLLLSLIAGSALAAGTAFDKATFDRLQQQGKPTLVVIHADWCPTCKSQDGVLGQLLTQAPFDGLAVLQVDFDAQKSVVKAFHAQYQSTLIVFRGGKEVARSVGDTRTESIAALLKQAL